MTSPTPEVHSFPFVSQAHDPSLLLSVFGFRLAIRLCLGIRCLTCPFEWLDCPFEWLDSPFEWLDSPFEWLDCPFEWFDSPLSGLIVLLSSLVVL